MPSVAAGSSFNTVLGLGETVNMVVPAGCHGTVTWRPIEQSGAAPTMTTGAQWATNEGTGRKFGPLAESFVLGPFGRYGNVTVVNDVTSLSAVDITSNPSLVGNIAIATGVATSSFRLSNNTGSISSVSTTGVIETMLYCTSANNVQLSSPAQAGNLQYTVRNAAGSHQFLNGATTLMTIDGNGNAGIGTTPTANARVSIARGTHNLELDVISTISYVTSYDRTGSAWKDLQIRGSNLVLASEGSERVRVKSTGQTRFIPLASDPAGAENGDVYYNSTTNKLRVYAGGLWVDLH